MSTIGSKRSTTALPQDGNLHILIVEDCMDSAVSMAMLLRMYGHEVEIASNGAEALTKVHTDVPDVVLLDIGLPGMSGYDVARQLHQQRNGKRPFLVAVTGFGQDEDRRHSAEAGIDLHLVKPVEPQKLQSLLARFKKVICN